MLKVLLVDDEFLVRLAFSNTINWMENDFELIGAVANGVEAYEIMKKERPDIVITDLTMPLMDGLELIEKSKGDGLPCEFVVLSCHNEFEYVKQSLKLGVFDYILKLSMDMKELMDVLERLRKKILSQRSDADSSLENFGQQDLGTARFRVVVAGADKVGMDEEEKINNQIIGFLQQMTGAIANKSVLIYRNMPVLLLWEEYAGLDQLLKEIQTEISKYLGISVDMGVGSIVLGNIHIRQSFDEAMVAYGHKFYTREKTISYYEKIYYEDAKNLSFVELFPDIQEILQIGIRRELKEVIPWNLKQICERENIEPSQLRMYLHELLTRIKLKIDEQKFETITGELYADIYQKVNKLEYLEDIEVELLYFLDLVLEQMELPGENDIVRNAKRYVHSHLGEDLRVMEVSKKLGVNADYLSHLFRLETGIRYIDYVNHTRIAYACEQLKVSNNKIYEIGEQCGFENTNYFIKVFKKHVGLTPLDYKKEQECIKF